MSTHDQFIFPLKNAGYEFNSQEELTNLVRNHITQIERNYTDKIVVEYYLDFTEKSVYPIYSFVVSRKGNNQIPITSS